MSEENRIIKELVDKCDSLAFLIGIATAIITDSHSRVSRDWWFKAVEEVIYRNGKVPPLQL